MSKQTATKIKAQDEGDGDIWSCPACTITVLLPELVVDYPTEDQIIDGNNAPVWTKPIRAQIKNFDGGNVIFEWVMIVEWNGDGGIYTPMDGNFYEGSVNGTKDNWVDLGIKVDEPILGGDQVTLSIRASTDRYQTFEFREEIFAIKGKNPSKADILAALGDDRYCAIACWESGFNQFHTRTYIAEKDKPNGPDISPYFPYQGVSTPKDIGIMQINNPMQYTNSDAIIWDWTVNVRKGKSIFDAGYSNAQTFHLYYPDPSGTAKNTPLSNDEGKDQLFLEAYCEYNGGGRQWYWDWVPPVIQKGILIMSGHWEMSEGLLPRHESGSKRARNYANTVNNIRKNRTWVSQ